jgi:hypothetical protein
MISGATRKKNGTSHRFEILTSKPPGDLRFFQNGLARKAPIRTARQEFFMQLSLQLKQDY